MANAAANFGALSNGALGGQTGWTTGRLAPGSDWAATVQTDAGAATGKSVLFGDVAWGTDGINSILFDTVGNSTGNFEIVFSWKFSVAPTAQALPLGGGLVAAADVNDCYALLYNGSGQWFLACYLNGAYDHAIGTGPTLFTPTNNVYYFGRISRNGTTLKANVWQTDIASEPVGYNISGGTDTTITNLRGALVHADQAYDQIFQQFGASTDGDGTAPFSAGGGGGSSIAAISAGFITRMLNN